jgi:hypothetical protein
MAVTPNEIPNYKAQMANEGIAARCNLRPGHQENNPGKRSNRGEFLHNPDGALNNINSISDATQSTNDHFQGMIWRCNPKKALAKAEKR